MQMKFPEWKSQFTERERTQKKHLLLVALTLISSTLDCEFHCEVSSHEKHGVEIAEYHLLHRSSLRLW